MGTKIKLLSVVNLERYPTEKALHEMIIRKMDYIFIHSLINAID